MFFSEKEQAKWRKVHKKEEELEKLLKKYKLTDENINGRGWWRNPETRARIRARSFAWYGIGIKNSIAPFLANYTLTPKIAKRMGDKITKLWCVGTKTKILIQALPNSADKEFKENYEYWYPIEIACAKKEFEEFRKKKGEDYVYE